MLKRTVPLVGVGALAIAAGLSGTAHADWTQVATTGGKQNTVWLDEGSIKQSGTSRTVLEMIDHTQPIVDFAGSPAYLSEVSKVQFDCTANTVLVLSYKHYAGHSGHGKIVDTYAQSGQPDADPIVAGSISEAEKGIVCK